MSIETIDNTAVVTEPAAPAPAPQTPPPAAPAPAAQVDIEKLEQIAADRAAKSAEKIMRDMLEKQGFDATAINSMTAEWKAKQKTPEQVAQEKDDEIARLASELEQTKNERIAAGKGVPDELIPDYVRLAAGYEGGTFTEKLDAALSKFPLAKPNAPPPYAAGTGMAPISEPEADAFQKKLDKYNKNRRT